MGSSLLPPSTPKRPAGTVFIGLNVIRLISMVSLILVVAATITNMVSDMNAVNRPSEVGARKGAQALTSSSWFAG